jgi:hypothetical protein
MPEHEAPAAPPAAKAPAGEAQRATNAAWTVILHEVPDVWNKRHFSLSRAWCVAAPALSAYQRRHWAKVITSSDLAVCRGKYTGKYGDSSRQLCTCKSAALETIEHFYFECAAYAAVRQPLTAHGRGQWPGHRMVQAQCRTPPRHGGGLAALWAPTHSQLLMPNGPNTAGDDLRKRALEFCAKAKAIRHPAHAKRLSIAPQGTGIEMARPSWRHRPRPHGDIPPNKSESA